MSGIEDLALRIFNELSGRQQQKVLIARAFVRRPEQFFYMSLYMSLYMSRPATQTYGIGWMLWKR